MNKNKINKIVEKILGYPLKSEVSISFFISILCEEFNEDEDVINDLLTDTKREDCEYLQTRLLKEKNSLNTARDDKLDFKIIPSTKSIHSASNNAPEFEKLCYEVLDNMQEGEKGRYFEKIVQYLFLNIGISTKTTETTGDNGIDLIGIGDEINPLMIRPTYFIQCKYYTNVPDVNLPKKVAADVMYNLFDMMADVHHPIIPIIVCNQSKTKSIDDFCKIQGIKYLSFKELVYISSLNMNLNFDTMVKVLK